MKAIALLLITLPLSGCLYLERERPLVADTVYSKAEMDAILARIQCRNLAPSLLYVARCDLR